MHIKNQSLIVMLRYVVVGLVQNTEVQLGCMKLRIGSMLAQCVGQVRVRADQGCGIFFTVKRMSRAVLYSIHFLQLGSYLVDSVVNICHRKIFLCFYCMMLGIDGCVIIGNGVCSSH